MFDRNGNIDKELVFSKPYSNIEGSPIIEPLRISKPKIQNPAKFRTSRACSSEIQMPCPDGRNKNDFHGCYESRSHCASISMYSTPRSRESSLNRESFIEAGKKPESPSRERNMSPKLRNEPEEFERINYMIQKGPASHSMLGAHHRGFSDQGFSTIPREQSPRPTSKYIPYLEPRRYQEHQYLPPQELDASPILKNDISQSITSEINRINSTTTISTTRTLRGSPPPEVSAMSLNFRSNNYELMGSTIPQGKASATQALKQQFQQLQLSHSPPPAYSSVSLDTIEDLQAESIEKNQEITTATHSIPHHVAAISHASTDPHYAEHPALANESRSDIINPKPDAQPTSGQQHSDLPLFQSLRPNSTLPVAQATISQQYSNSPPFQSLRPNTPPLLPEGWISNLDQNSGQLYYIHIKTNVTQWEFPTGPTPSDYNVAQTSPGLTTYSNPHMSPGLSTFTKCPFTSPRFSSLSDTYNDSILRSASQTPTTAGFTQPPPSAGVDMFKIRPTNGVYFGPYLRYINMDIQRGIWLGSIMLITDTPQPPTIHIHQTIDISPGPRQLKPISIFTHQRWTFYRYNVNLQMGDRSSDKWTYAITSHLGCTRYEFLVASRYETNWKFIAHSGNDFAINTSIHDRTKLGGIGVMWKDILHKHLECGGFHVQLGLGDQIYGDRLWKEIPLLKQWLAISGKENRKNAPWTIQHEEDVLHAYFHYYTSHFDQQYIREAFAQIPHILQLDHHDIFNGFGSYPDYLQSSNIFENIGRVGIQMYLLFQHHTTLDMLCKSASDTDLFTITGSGWHFIKFLGPAVAVVGPDCRSERNQRQVLAGPTYQGIFPKVINLPLSIQHCIWMISVPVIYPRQDTFESFAHTFTTAKKGVTGTYNLLGKMTSSVAGVVGGKQAVASGFSQVKKVVGKSGLMGGVLNTFGDIDIADDPRDMWTHESKDLERTYFIRTLHSIAHQRGMRMTFLSGDVNCGGAGLVHDPAHPSNHKTIYQIISSAVVAAPLPYVHLKMLHNHKILYVPPNGQKTTNLISDTKEDMMEIFKTEPDGSPREMKKLIGRRNYVIFMAYDPNDISGVNHGTSEEVERQQQQTPKKLSLAVDFIVQNEGQNVTSKYGPVIIPSLEYGK